MLLSHWSVRFTAARESPYTAIKNDEAVTYCVLAPVRIYSNPPEFMSVDKQTDG